MLQQITIPRTQDEIAASLARLTRENRRFVESAIAVLTIRQGMDERQQRLTTDIRPGK